jgi:hypothetical protein
MTGSITSEPIASTSDDSLRTNRTFEHTNQTVAFVYVCKLRSINFEKKKHVLQKLIRFNWGKGDWNLVPPLRRYTLLCRPYYPDEGPTSGRQ